MENRCLGSIKGVAGASIVFNKKTGKSYEEISLYEQIVDASGKELKEPVTGDNFDFVLINNGEEILLVDLFKKMQDAPSIDPQKGEKE